MGFKLNIRIGPYNYLVDDFGGDLESMGLSNKHVPRKRIIKYINTFKGYPLDASTYNSLNGYTNSNHLINYTNVAMAAFEDGRAPRKNRNK